MKKSFTFYISPSPPSIKDKLINMSIKVKKTNKTKQKKQ